MFGKRSRKKNNCRANSLFVQGSVYRPSKADSLDQGWHCSWRDVCQRFTSERRERERKVEGIYRERKRKRRDIGRTNLRRGYDGPLMRLPPCTVAWQPHSRRSEPTPRHVSISRPRIAPRRRNVTRKRADPRSTRHAFWLEAGCFAGTRNPLIGRRPANAFPCRWFFPLFFFYGAEIAGRIDTCRKNCCRALESLRENIVIANLFPRFSFSSKNKHRSKRYVCMCMYIYIYL